MFHSPYYPLLPCILFLKMKAKNDIQILKVQVEGKLEICNCVYISSRMIFMDVCSKVGNDLLCNSR